jgi:branched-subunit amino acid transport protein
MSWTVLLVTAVGCYLLKLAGLSVPPRVLERPVVERVAGLMPVALLAALVAVQTVARGHELVVDARALGVLVAVGLLLLRAPFLVVVVGAALAAALVRLL